MLRNGRFYDWDGQPGYASYYSELGPSKHFNSVVTFFAFQTIFHSIAASGSDRKPFLGYLNLTWILGLAFLTIQIILSFIGWHFTRTWMIGGWQLLIVFGLSAFSGVVTALISSVSDCLNQK